VKISSSILLIILSLCSTGIRAQPGAGIAVSNNKNNNLTIVYDISISSNNKKAGIEEAYNGGIKTVMLQNGKARIRLVSLMRIQSLYFFTKDSALTKVLITKESGKKKYKYQLSAADWKRHNAKYDSITYSLLDETKSVAGYTCKKAIITVPGENKEVIVYYSTELKPLDNYIEPLFAGIPGVVLQYVSETTNGNISFTASKISFEPVDENLLQEPTSGYVQKNYDAPVR